MSGNPTTTPEQESNEKEVQDKIRTGKIVLIFVMFLLTQLGAYAPWCIRHLKRATEWMSIACCFTAGIILGAGLLHMIPEAQASWGDYFAQRNESETALSQYPWTPLLAISMLFLLMVVDVWLVGSGLESAVFGDAVHRNSHAHHGGHGGHDDVVHHHHGGFHHHGHVPHNTESSTRVAPASLSSPEQVPFPDLTCAPTSHVTTSIPSIDTLERSRGGRANEMRAWVYFIALSIHSLFDGLGLGAVTAWSDFIALVAAVVSHELMDGFSVGVPVFMAGWSRTRTCCVFTCVGLASPIGIMIGLIATSSTSGADAALGRAIMLSLSAGSFLFLSLVELLPNALKDNQHLFKKFTATALGIASMALLAIWA